MQVLQIFQPCLLWASPAARMKLSLIWRGTCFTLNGGCSRFESSGKQERLNFLSKKPH